MTDENELVERVAKAIDDEAWKCAPPRDLDRAYALAALSTIRPGDRLPGGMVVREHAYRMLVAYWNGDGLSKDEGYLLSNMINEIDRSINPAGMVDATMVKKHWKPAQPTMLDAAKGE